MVYNFTISQTNLPHLDLFPFELFRQPLVVLAIADAQEKQPASSAHADGIFNGNGFTSTSEYGKWENLFEELAFLKQEYPRALVHKLVLFDYDESPAVLKNQSDVALIPAGKGATSTTMKTVMCDISTSVLGEMCDFAETIQGLPTVESPRLSKRTEASMTDKIRHRMTMPANLQRQNSGASSHISTSGWRPAMSPAPTTFDEISRSTSRGSLKPRSTTNSPKEQSRDRMSMQGPTSAGEKSKIRVQGRINVVLGSLYLQAGRWQDALKTFVESAEIARVNSDYLWYAKSLESILVSMLMLAWAGMDFSIPQICFPIHEKPGKSNAPALFENKPKSAPETRLQSLTNLLPDLIGNILNQYLRATHITDESLPQLPLSETIIRFSKLLAVIQIRDSSLDEEALAHIVLNTPLQPAATPLRPPGGVILRKAEICSLLFQALPISHYDLSTPDMISVLIGMASILTMLNLHRKKAFILKELLSHLTPGLVQARKVGAAEMGIHPAAGLSALATTAFAINALDVGPGNMEEGLRALLDAVGQPHGVCGVHEPLGKASLSDDEAERDTPDQVAIRALRRSSLWTFGDLALKIDILRACINFCEALPDFQGVLQFTVELLHSTRRALMLPVDYRIGLPALPQDEQIRLFNNIKRTSGAASKLGVPNLEAEYWDDFLIRDIELLELAPSKRLLPHHKREFDLAAPSGSEEKAKGPFLHNAFAKATASAAEKLLVADDYAQFKVTFQNPYEFDIEIEYVKLLSESNEIETQAQTLVIGPYCMQDMIFAARAKQEGTLKITGALVKVKYCRERKFSIFKKRWAPNLDHKLSRVGLGRRGLPRERPLSSVSETLRSPAEKKPSGPEAETISFNVTKPQPRISVVSTSLSQSALMVLEGESKRFTITLKNESETPADLVLLTFQDSTLAQLQTAMSNRDITPIELYELELQLSTRPALRWHVEENESKTPSIAPHATATFTVEVFGKPGLLDGVVQIDYAHLGCAREAVKDKFYTRQVLFPITVTVNASAELARCDILPFTSNFAWQNQRKRAAEKKARTGSLSSSSSESSIASNASRGDNEFMSLLSRLGLGSHSSDHCTLLMDIRNTWPSPLSISITVRHPSLQKSNSKSKATDPNRAYTIHEQVQPGHISRLVLLVPRIHVDNPRKPIPSLNITNKRQYVVSALRVSLEQEASSREAFWFREEILKCVSATWEENGSGRKGVIDLRGMRFSARMVEAIRIEDVGVSFAVTQPNASKASIDAESIVQTARSTFKIKPRQFLTLHTTLKNNTSSPLHPLLRLQPCLKNQPLPITLDLPRRFVCSGMLQRTLPVLEPGESKTVDLGITALCEGEFEIGASVEEVRVLKAKDGDKDGEGGKKDNAGSDMIVENDVLRGKARQRRIWHAREPCVILAGE